MSTITSILIPLLIPFIHINGAQRQTLPGSQQSFRSGSNTNPWEFENAAVVARALCPSGGSCVRLRGSGSGSAWSYMSSSGYHSVNVEWDMRSESLDSQLDNDKCKLFYIVGVVSEDNWVNAGKYASDAQTTSYSIPLPQADNDAIVGIWFYLNSVGASYINDFKLTGIKITPSPTQFPTTATPTTVTSNPTPSPTKSPTHSTYTPTSSPTLRPTLRPTLNPTNIPTNQPSNTPSHNPTMTPTTPPTSAPSNAPTNPPTEAPTITPTLTPTTAPTNTPSDAPSDNPSTAPTDADSDSFNPSSAPTDPPTSTPTKEPTGTLATHDRTEFIEMETKNDREAMIARNLFIIGMIGIGFAVLCLVASFTLWRCYMCHKRNKTSRQSEQSIAVGMDSNVSAMSGDCMDIDGTVAVEAEMPRYKTEGRKINATNEAQHVVNVPVAPQYIDDSDTSSSDGMYDEMPRDRGTTCAGKERGEGDGSANNILVDDVAGDMNVEIDDDDEVLDDLVGSTLGYQPNDEDDDDDAIIADMVTPRGDDGDRNRAISRESDGYEDSDDEVVADLMASTLGYQPNDEDDDDDAIIADMVTPRGDDGDRNRAISRESDGYEDSDDEVVADLMASTLGYQPNGEQR
eukprot:721398_1